MGHSKAIGVLLAVGVGLGCTTALSYLDRPFRTPGEKLRSFPEKVWRQYECDAKSLPFFKLERVELFPKRLHAGEEFKQRLIYALCPAKSTGVVTGRLETRILHRGKPIVSEREPKYDLKPGRWVIDAFVKLPESAAVGIYAFEVKFHSRKVRFERSVTFAVE